MTTQDMVIKKKLSLLELSEFLHNVSEACRINGCSRQHFYDVRGPTRRMASKASRRKAGGNPV